MKNFKRIFFVVLSFFAFIIGNKFSYCLCFNLNELSQNLYKEFNNDLIKIHSNQEAILGGIIGIICIIFIYLYRKYDRKNYKQYKEHGSAEWGTRKDIVSVEDKKEDNNKILTGTEKMSINTRKTFKNNNTIVIGGSRKW